MYSSWSGNGNCDHPLDCVEVLVIDEPKYKKWVCANCGGGCSENFLSEGDYIYTKEGEL